MAAKFSVFCYCAQNIPSLEINNKNVGKIDPIDLQSGSDKTTFCLANCMFLLQIKIISKILIIQNKIYFISKITSTRTN